MKHARSGPVIGVLALLLLACGEEPMPKPRGYFRLDLPEQDYEVQNNACHFAAEIPRYALMVRRPGDTLTHADTVCWSNLWLPGQRATVHMTYRRVMGDLPELINDAHAFKDKHEAKAARIKSERILRPEAKVFGNIFNVDGDVASPVVFYFTDSTTHFLYGSLYFDSRPNADSLKPVTDRIRADLQHFAQTLSWR